MSLVKYQKWSAKVYLFFKGLLMGLANRIPGVSGGTVSFVLGFYEELIYSFQKFNYKAIKLLMGGRFKSLYRYLNLTFLIYLMLGNITSYFTISVLLDYFLSDYEILVWSLFFGLIIGSIYYVSRQFKVWKIQNTLFVCVGLFVGIWISFIVPTQANENLLFVFLCGCISVCGMTLPGLSGSFILMLLGNYELLMVDTVNIAGKGIAAIVSGDFGFFAVSEHIYFLKLLTVFVAGSLTGLVSTAHILAYLLKRWHNGINALLIGFISGSLIAVYPWKHFHKNHQFTLYLPDFQDLTTYQAIFFIILGIAVVLVLMHFEKKKIKYK